MSVGVLPFRCLSAGWCGLVDTSLGGMGGVGRTALSGCAKRGSVTPHDIVEYLGPMHAELVITHLSTLLADIYHEFSGGAAVS